jgi:hypothetical protein
MSRFPLRTFRAAPMARGPPKDGQPKLKAKRRFIAANDWFVGHCETDARTDSGETVPRCGTRLAPGPPKDGRPEPTFDSAAFWTLAYRAFDAA